MADTRNDNLITVSSDATQTDATQRTLVSIEAKPVYDMCKRCFDVVCAFFGLIILLVPLLLVALAIVIDSPGASPIYVQERVGKNGRKFKFFKFDFF